MKRTLACALFLLSTPASTEGSRAVVDMVAAAVTANADLVNRLEPIRDAAGGSRASFWGGVWTRLPNQANTILSKLHAAVDLQGLNDFAHCLVFDAQGFTALG